MMEKVAAATRPLEGRRIVVTRARKQSHDLVKRLQELGATVIECPAISIAPLDDYSRLDHAIAALEQYDWIIFTSVNGVEAFAERLHLMGKDMRALLSSRVGAIGPATAVALEGCGRKPDFMPNTYIAEAIVEQIGDVRGCRVLLPRADIAREALANGLREKGARVDVVTAYRTVHGEAAGALITYLHSGAVDAVTFTSSSTVRYTIDGLTSSGLTEGEAVELLNRAAVVCIGPITAATARGYGLRVDTVAENYTLGGLVDALIGLFAQVQRR
jgi:uroporphyrinogen III methyltransferase / synthase